LLVSDPYQKWGLLFSRVRFEDLPEAVLSSARHGLYIAIEKTL